MNTASASTPVQDGFFMPPEFAPQDAIWLVWPKDKITFPGRCLESVRSALAIAVREISACEKVKLLVDNSKVSKQVEYFLKQRGAFNKNVQLVEKKTVDVWIRDYGPTFVINGKGKKAAIKWKFNAWGGKYADLAKDDGVFAKGIPGQPKLKVYRPKLVLEGGSLDVNGKGVVLTTRQCLLNKNRNPNLTQEQIEWYLGQYLGVKTVAWLNDGIEGDDTDGHVDDIARFVAPDTIAYAKETDKRKSNFKALAQNEKLLKSLHDSKGRKFKLLPIAMPEPCKYGKRVIPASHLNFLITNKCVLAPVFGGKSDQPALRTLAKAFPTRKIVPIPSNEWVVGNGAIHCSSQQEPKA